MESGDSIISLSLGSVAEPSGLVVVKPWSWLYPPGVRAPAVGGGHNLMLSRSIAFRSAVRSL